MSHGLPVNGKAYLVGAGPGDPGLLTIRGRDCLARADVVLYDYLVNPQILEHAPATAELVCLGRHGRDRIMPQEEINRRMVDFALAGRQVVRLKGGDPTVFAHAVEEIDALAAANVPYEIVPGITAAMAASSYAEIPLTHGEWSSAVALVTAQERQDKHAPMLDFAMLAKFPGTLVFYMGVTTASHWTTALILDGMPADTPVAVVHRCSLPDQAIFRCTLGTVADELEARHIRPPSVVIVGKVVTQARPTSWFSARPLFGLKVMIPRPAGQAAPLVEQLAEQGAATIVQPAIAVGPPADWGPLDAALDRVGSYDWLVFSSANGVRFFLDRLLASGGDLRRLAGTRLAAIGPATAGAIAAFHLRADVVPKEFRAESLATALLPAASGKRFLLVRASRGREVLAETLRSAGAQVDQVVAYSSTDVAEPDPQVAELLANGQIDWITVTSSSIARSLVQLFGPDLSKAKLASISPVTSETLRSLGHEPTCEARDYTTAGVVQAIGEYQAGRPHAGASAPLS